MGNQLLKLKKKATRILILKSTDNHTCRLTNLKSHKLMQNLLTNTHTDAQSKGNHTLTHNLKKKSPGILSPPLELGFSPSKIYDLSKLR